MFGAVVVLLMFGFPVAFTLLGTAIAFALLGASLGLFDLGLLSALPLRIAGLMENDLLQAIPLFLYLGVILQQTTLAADLLEGLAAVFRPPCRRARGRDHPDQHALGPHHRRGRRHGAHDRPPGAADHARRRLRPQARRGHRLQRRHARHHHAALDRAHPARRLHAARQHRGPARARQGNRLGNDRPGHLPGRAGAGRLAAVALSRLCGADRGHRAQALPSGARSARTAALAASPACDHRGPLGAPRTHARPDHQRPRLHGRGGGDRRRDRDALCHPARRAQSCSPRRDAPPRAQAHRHGVHAADGRLDLLARLPRLFRRHLRRRSPLAAFPAA